VFTCMAKVAALAKGIYAVTHCISIVTFYHLAVLRQASVTSTKKRTQIRARAFVKRERAQRP
jgi:hypothetical protein